MLLVLRDGTVALWVELQGVVLHDFGEAHTDPVDGSVA